jgi:hypothetical protein
MPYFVIEKTPVFLTNEQCLDLRKETNHKELDEKFTINDCQPIYDFLIRKCNENKEEFHKNWVYFKLEKTEAQNNIWDLLYDYSHYYKNSFVDDTNDYTIMLEKLLPNEVKHPVGRTFWLFYQKKPFKWYNYIFHKKESDFDKILIDMDKVEKIHGKLSSFDVKFNNGSSIWFHKEVSIKPY